MRTLSQHSGSSGQNVALFVALYLVTLAFFIMLYSISHRDTKRQDLALNSLNQTFKEKQITTNPIEHKLANEASKREAIQQLFKAIETLFKETSPMVPIDQQDEEGILRLHIPTQELFAHQRTEINYPYRHLVEKLSNLLKNTPAELSTHTHILMGSRPIIPHYEQENALAILRIHHLSESLDTHGFQSDKITLGVQSHFPKHMIVQIHAAFLP